MQINYKSSPLLGPFSAQNNVSALFQQAVQLHQQGQLTQAQFLYDRILGLQPKHAQTLHLKGVIATQTGQLQRAVELFDQAIKADPGHPAFYCNRGNALLQLNRATEAVSSYDRAIELVPDYADAFANRGAALAALGRLVEAVASYVRATDLNPKLGMAYYNCATALQAQKRYEESLAQYDKALSLKTDWLEAHCGKGNVLKEMGQAEEAIASYDRCINLNPNYADAHFHRGAALRAKGETESAIAAYEQALALKPDFVEAHGNLADCFYAQNKYLEALGHYTKALVLTESVEARAGFARCVRHIRFIEATPEITQLMRRAIAESWIRPSMLFGAALSLIKMEPLVKDCMEKASEAWPERLTEEKLFGTEGLSKVASDGLLQAVLQYMAVPNIELERFLTTSRRILLDMALKTPVAEDGATEVHEALAFFSALACQCFVNDYAYADSPAERAELAVLEARISDRLASGAKTPEIWLAAAAAYAPLHARPFVAQLKSQTWDPSVQTLITRQVDEPALESEHRGKLNALTAIENAVSDLVQGQYEDNPYPRWIKTAFNIKPHSANDHLRALLPHSDFVPLANSGSPEVLIAGCGTGQQSIEAAQKLQGAKVLAIDLSTTSLGYAMRKTAEHGLENIQYAQADILRLGDIHRSFDIVESVGVLHHLQDPMAGWKVLTNMLRPGGFMRLGFYSELARRDIVKAQQFVVQEGYQATPEDIRRCRQDLMAPERRAAFGNLFTMRDFFGISECRDLLFHVQEHRYTIPQLKADLAALGLSFLGFFFENDTCRKYAERFPDDLSQTNLDNWHVFEVENPDTFISMYQFWTQKGAALTTAVSTVH